MTAAYNKSRGREGYFPFHKVHEQTQLNPVTVVMSVNI